MAVLKKAPTVIVMDMVTLRRSSGDIFALNLDPHLWLPLSLVSITPIETGVARVRVSVWLPTFL